METKVKENGQAKGTDLKADRTPKFVAGNPVNAVSQKAEAGKSPEPPKPDARQPEIGNSNPVQHAPKQGLNLDQTLKLVADLAKKTALRDRYIGYVDALAGFEAVQKDDVDELEEETAFQQCELVITDHMGNVFSTKSPSVIKGTVAFIKGRMSERLAEVEAGITLPA